MEKKRIIADIFCINRKPKIDINSDVHSETISVSPDISFEYSSVLYFIQFIEKYLATVYQKNFYLNIYDATDINSGKIELCFIADDMTATVFISEDISDKVEVVYDMLSGVKLSDNPSKRDYYHWTYLFNTVSDAVKYVSSKYEEILAYLKNDPSVTGEILKVNETRTDCNTIIYSITAHQKNEGNLSHSWYIPISQEEMYES